MGELPWLYELGIVDEVELGLLDRSAAGAFRSALRASAYHSRSCYQISFVLRRWRLRSANVAPGHRWTHLRACDAFKGVRIT